MAKLTGKQKVAALLLTLDTETSAWILSNFEERDITQLARAMGSLGQLDEETLTEVLSEFTEAMEGGMALSTALTSMEGLLQKALGPRKAEEIMNYVSGNTDDRPKPFQKLSELSVDELLTLLSGEHPQTIALVLSHLDPQHAAGVIAQMPEDLQVDVVTRIATTQTATADLLRQIDEIIMSKVDSLGDRPYMTSENRYKTVAEILNMAGRSAEDTILEKMSEIDPEMAQEIRNLVFVFEDITLVDDRGLQKALPEIDTETLALALKSSSEQVKEKIFHNLSKRQREVIQEELELMPPKPVSEVENAQREIIEVIRNLEARGELVVEKGGAQETYV